MKQVCPLTKRWSVGCPMLLRLLLLALVVEGCAAQHAAGFLEGAIGVVGQGDRGPLLAFRLGQARQLAPPVEQDAPDLGHGPGGWPPARPPSPAARRGRTSWRINAS